MLRLPPASAQAPHPSSCRERQASVAALRLLFPRQTLRWFASERPLRGRFSFASDFQQCRGDSKGGEPLCVVVEEGGHGGETPSKGFLLPCVFLVTFARAKSNSGSGVKPPKLPGFGGGAPARFRKETCFIPTRPATRESALHRPDALAQRHLERAQRRSLC